MLKTNDLIGPGPSLAVRRARRRRILQFSKSPEAARTATHLRLPCRNSSQRPSSPCFAGVKLIPSPPINAQCSIALDPRSTALLPQEDYSLPDPSTCMADCSWFNLSDGDVLPRRLLAVHRNFHVFMHLLQQVSIDLALAPIGRKFNTE